MTSLPVACSIVKGRRGRRKEGEGVCTVYTHSSARRPSDVAMSNLDRDAAVSIISSVCDTTYNNKNNNNNNNKNNSNKNNKTTQMI